MEINAFTIVSDVCEGIGDCFAACPVDCIGWAQDKINAKGTKYAYIRGDECISCGGCLSACPIEGAILDEWFPELQKV